MARMKTQAEKKRRADEIQMGKIEADKECALKELELKAKLNCNLQATISAIIDSTPPNRDAKSPPKLRAFVEE